MARLPLRIDRARVRIRIGHVLIRNLGAEVAQWAQRRVARREVLDIDQSLERMVGGDEPHEDRGRRRLRFDRRCRRCRRPTICARGTRSARGGTRGTRRCLAPLSQRLSYLHGGSEHTVAHLRRARLYNEANVRQAAAERLRLRRRAEEGIGQRRTRDERLCGGGGRHWAAIDLAATEADRVRLLVSGCEQPHHFANACAQLEAELVADERLAKAHPDDDTAVLVAASHRPARLEPLWRRFDERLPAIPLLALGEPRTRR